MTEFSYVFTATCPECVVRLVHVTGSKPSKVGTESSAVGRCPECAREWLMTLHLRPMRRFTPEREAARSRQRRHRAKAAA